MRTLLDTSASPVLTFQRLVLALVMGAHGVQKAFGWFGGFGFDGTLGFFTQTLHVPALFAVLVILGETLGALGLAFGAFTRVAAAGAAATLIGAVVLVHAHYGFYMNWGGNQGGEGFELHLLGLGLALPLAVLGGGAYSVDRVAARWLRSGAQAAARRVASAGA